MAEQLIPLSISTPGFFGLNTQLGSNLLTPGWAAVATNLVYDDQGKLVSRLGTKDVSTGNSLTFLQLHEYKDDSENTILLGTTSTKIYTIDVSASPATVTDVTGTITTPTDGNWQFMNFNGKVIGVQTGHNPIAMPTIGGAFADIVFTAPAAWVSTPPQPKAGMVAGGRVWFLVGNTDVYYSEILTETNFGTAPGNGFDLGTLHWKDGIDTAVALAEHNGFWMVFGNDSCMIYSDAFDPTASVLQETLGLGCVARDSIKSTGVDLVFLSKIGLVSLSRVVQEKSIPASTIGKNVAGYTMDAFNAAGAGNDKTKSVYNSRTGEYYLFITNTVNASLSRTLCFNLKYPNQDGSARVTEWDFTPRCAVFAEDLTTYVNSSNLEIAALSGYKDGVLHDGTGGSSYLMDWISAWNDFGEEAQPFLKIPKRGSLTLEGGAGSQAVFKWGFDYSPSFRTANVTIDSATLPYYGIAQYGIDTYKGNFSINKTRYNLSSTGQTLRFGTTITVNGTKIGIQRIDFQIKLGRIVA